MTRTWAIAMWAVCVMGSQPAYGQTQQAGSRMLFPDGLAKLVVQQAIRGAAARLEHPECQLVLIDFKDEAGRTLRENLERLERRPAEFLAELWFVDKSREQSCTTSNVSAFTTPFTRVVYVCGTSFISPTHPMRGKAGEIIIIHEMLHALGLGEKGRNPTASRITKQVAARCGKVI